MSIPVTIYDKRTQKEFRGSSDRIPVEKIIKTPGFTLRHLCFALKEDAIVMEYILNETPCHSLAFRKYCFPLVELNDSVIDTLIDLCWTTLYEEGRLYSHVERSLMPEWPEGALVDTYEHMGFILFKFKSEFKLIIESQFEESDEHEFSDKVRLQLMSKEPEFQCPEEYKDTDWWEFLRFQPDEILVQTFDDVKVTTFCKRKLGITHYRFTTSGETDDGTYMFYTIPSSRSTVRENGYVLEKLEFSNYTIYKTAKNVRLTNKLKVIKRVDMEESA